MPLLSRFSSNDSIVEMFSFSISPRSPITNSTAIFPSTTIERCASRPKQWPAGLFATPRPLGDQHMSSYAPDAPWQPNSARRVLQQEAVVQASRALQSILFPISTDREPLFAPTRPSLHALFRPAPLEHSSSRERQCERQWNLHMAHHRQPSRSANRAASTSLRHASNPQTPSTCTLDSLMPPLPSACVSTSSQASRIPSSTQRIKRVPTRSRISKSKAPTCCIRSTHSSHLALAIDEDTTPPPESTCGVLTRARAKAQACSTRHRKRYALRVLRQDVLSSVRSPSLESCRVR